MVTPRGKKHRPEVVQRGGCAVGILFWLIWLRGEGAIFTIPVGEGSPLIDGNLRDKKSEKRKGVEGRNIKGN